MQDPNKLDWLQNWDEGEGTNILSITEILDVAGLFCKVFLLLLFSMQTITTGVKVKTIRNERWVDSA